MKLYNTRTKQIEPVTALQPAGLRIYSCGPTVYNEIHIGNLSSFIFADMVRRVAAQTGKVTHVMNITDIDDKTIKGSRVQMPDTDPMNALLTVTDKYSQKFFTDMKLVGNDIQAVTFTKATDHIGDMQALISALYDHKIAYITEDGVYFDIDAYRKSGKVYGQLTEISAESTSEARIDNDEYDKESVHDFALWKKQKPGEPAWEYMLDGHNITGRPGWHIECSAMSQSSLDMPFDIHTGGIDLIFPHHENEIAQSTATQHDPIYATVFAHNEHLLIDGKKMAKSLNNFYTVSDIVANGYDPLAFRMLVLQSHYRNQAHFSWENLGAAQNRLRELQAVAALRWQALPLAHDAGTFSLRDVPEELATILAEDLSTPHALAFLSRVSTQLLAVLIEEDMLDHFVVMLEGIDALLGLKLCDIGDISDDLKLLIESRTKAREEKNWEEADALRQKLTEQKIGVRDTPDGAIWFPL
ncbi:MAG: cysteine--tRNA ligase [Patescibacteria group bacterium]|nr:cysteine--tRNA ligase [Patescibacteria group bacterium]